MHVHSNYHMQANHLQQACLPRAEKCLHPPRAKQPTGLLNIQAFPLIKQSEILTNGCVTVCTCTCLYMRACVGAWDVQSVLAVCTHVPLPFAWDQRAKLVYGMV
jgi:hypothetical protein